MSQQCRVTFINQRYAKEYPEGTLISDILKTENIRVPFPCNGQGTCGKCRVKVTGAVTPPTSGELKQISAAESAAGIRLACQSRLRGPVELEVSEVSTAKNILEDGLFHIERLNPVWGRLTLPKPAVLSWEAMPEDVTARFKPELAALQALASLPADGKELTLEYLSGRIIDIYDSIPDKDRSGVAVDIGTTTLAVYLVDFNSGRIVKTASAYNPQADYGADVVSRINYANQHKSEGLTKLHSLIITAVNGLITELLSDLGKTGADIIQVNLVGNSCMIHLLLNISPSGLGQIPFEPAFKSPIELTPPEISIKINPRGRLFCLPGIGGFIGSDIAAGVLACKLNPDRKELFIDIGTNGEVILTGRGRMLACSTAAGPAFEGATISCGMLAKPGAVTDLQISDDSVTVTTLNNEAPIGICGTGLIRALVELVRKGLIIETGRFADEIKHPNFDREQKRFYLTMDGSRPVYISQQDIRQFQLAKGAIRAGLEILLKRLEIQAAELETFYLAGAFGTYLNPEDAIFIGLIPAVPLERIKAVGNTAGTGAVISLLSQTALADLSAVVGRIEHIELANDPQFTEIFTDSMMF